MSYLLLHHQSNTVIKRYSTLGSARTGMRASNKNAGWSARVSRCFSNYSEREWCTNGTDWDYAPYTLIAEGDYCRLKANA